MSQTSLYLAVNPSYKSFFEQFLRGKDLTELENDFDISLRELFCILSNLFQSNDIYDLIFLACENEMVDLEYPPLQNPDDIVRLVESISKAPYLMVELQQSQFIDVFIKLCRLGTEIKNLSIRNQRLQFL